MKKLVSTILIFCLLLAFSACGRANVEGTYWVESIDGVPILQHFKNTAEHLGVSLEEHLEGSGMTEETVGSYITMELKSGGSDHITRLLQYTEGGPWDADELECSWEQKGSTITVTSLEMDPLEFRFEHGKLIYSESYGKTEHSVVMARVGD